MKATASSGWVDPVVVSECQVNGCSLRPQTIAGRVEQSHFITRQPITDSLPLDMVSCLPRAWHTATDCRYRIAQWEIAGGDKKDVNLTICRSIKNYWLYSLTTLGVYLWFMKILT